jgi:hypothetical protein
MKAEDIGGLTVFTIATNKYWEYFLNLLPNLRAAVSSECRIEVIVLTNRHPEGEMPTELENLKVTVRASEFQDWPEVTLLRYGQILKHRDLINNTRFLWIDVDMKFQKKLDLGLFYSGVRLALHPGYVFNTRGFLRLKFGEQKDFILEKLKLAKKNQFARGAWEENPDSSAYVKPRMRKAYVHGAIWGGETQSVLSMCETLDQRIREDLVALFIATWHDESHLNWFHANHPQNLFPVDFSGAPKHWTSNTSKSVVISLDKASLDIQLGI